MNSLSMVALGWGLLAQSEEYVGDADFRSHVWFAYGLVLVFLLGFSIWAVARLAATRSRVEHLSERFEKAHPEESPERAE